MKYCAGIDGGQSSTHCVVADEAGAVVARVSGGPADLVGLPRDSERRAALIDSLLERGLAVAHLPPETRFAAVVAGISGWDEGHAVAPHVRLAETFRAVHDAEAAHAGAFDGGPGIALIAGTGSVALGIDSNGRRVRCGGWGYLFGDEGSAFWIAREAVGRAMRDEDNAAPGELAERARHFFGVGSLRALQHAVAHHEIDRPRIAAFTPHVLEIARHGERGAIEIRAAAIEALAGLVHATLRRLGTSLRLPIAPLGGLFDDLDFLDRWRWAVRAREPAARIVKARNNAEFGALRLAFRDAGIEAGPLGEREA